MSKASEVMERLLQGEQVEWVKLGEISDFFGGLTGKNKTHFGKGNGRYIPYTNIFNNKSVDFDSLEAVVVIDDERQNAVHRGDVLLTLSSETLDEVGMSSVVLNESQQPVYMNSFCLGTRFKDKDLLIPEFSKYLFRSNLIRNQIRRSANGVTRFNLSRDKLRKIEIPIPPLHVQEKIVSILDTFTELTKELTKEQQARQTQYEYYRDKLLTFEDGEVEWRALSQIADISRGASPRPISKYLTEDKNGIGWVRIGDVPSNSKYVTKTKEKITNDGALKSRILKKGDFILSNSMSYGRPYIMGIEAAIHDGWAAISNFDHVLDKDFLYFYLTSNQVNAFWKSKINSGSVSNLNSRIIGSLLVPILPKEKQIKIAKQLDYFFELANSITEGLPREIELRQQQYEYYRDLLLDFPNAA